MGMSSGKKSGGRRESLSEINVTPLVDVMLVLLIIFMVTAPMTKTGVTVELPKTQKTDSIELKKPLDITITSKNKIIVNKKSYTLAAFKNMLDSSKKLSARVEADKSSNYGTVAKVLSMIKNKGITNIALVTEEGQ